MEHNQTLVRLTGLWENADGEGRLYLAGSVSPSCRLLIFANDQKEEDSEPDYIAYLAPQEKREKGKRQAR